VLQLLVLGTFNLYILCSSAKYQKYSGPHKVENHRSMAWCCKANPKFNPSREATADGAFCSYIFKYINYKSEHSADDIKCSF